MITTTLNISQQEEEIHRLQSTIDRLASAIHSGEERVRFAQQDVHEQEAAMCRAENEVHQVEQRVERAHLCLNGRRKKRFLGSWSFDSRDKPSTLMVLYQLG